jgi:heparan-alpha-glucosaminide N-acetyltransferase
MSEGIGKEANSASVPGRAGLGDRSVGLDVLRGVIMMVLAVLVFTPTTGWRGHPDWWGWRPSDAFFPGFLTVAGAGLALQTKRGMPWMRLGRRLLALLVIGVAYNALLGGGLDLATLRLPGVLQRIAIVGMLGAIVVWACRRSSIAVMGVALVLCLAWGAAIDAAASSCPNKRPERATACGTFLDLDEAVFTASHLYANGQAGHEPEGIASTTGALATFLIGFAAARLLLERGSSVRRRAALLLAGSAAWAAITPALLAFAPVGKRMWTPGFVGANAAAYLAAWSVLVLLFDSAVAASAVRAVRRWAAYPFVAVGRNALVLWLIVSVFDHAVVVTTTSAGTLRASLLTALGPVGYFAVCFGGWLGIALAMDVTRWHVRL